MPAVKNQNTYASLSEADAYLADSVRATGWSFIGTTEKTRALITATRVLQRQRWQGVVAPLRTAKTASIAAAGTGYAAGDKLTVVGGTGQATLVSATSVDGGGAVTAVSLDDAGLYSIEPASPASTSGGGGTGLTLTLVFENQLLHFPAAGLVRADTTAVDPTTVPLEIQNGQIELAFELSQDSLFETQENVGSNVKRAEGGPAKVEFFRGTLDSSTRFPPVVMELVGQFLSGAATAPTVSGGTDPSAFTDCANFGLNKGLD